MTTVLVTGASGFVGAVLADRLAASGCRVLRTVRGRAVADDEVALDLAGAAPLVLPAGIDHVAHLAQSRAYRQFPADAPEMFAVNVAGTAALLKAAADAGVKRFCLVSSGSVYEPFEGEMRESQALQPRSYLGASKAAAEIVAGPYASLMAVSVLRLFTPYGPGQVARLIPDLITRVREGRAVTLSGGKEGMRFSPTYVDDVCDVIATSLASGWTGTFNVATPEILTLRQAVTMIGTIVGREPVFETVEGRALSLVPHLGQLASRMDLSGFTPFAEGIAACIEAEGRHGR